MDFPDSSSLHPFIPATYRSLQVFLYPHRTVVDKFLLVGKHWHVHLKRSLRERHLLLQRWHQCLVRLTWMVLEMGCKWPCRCWFVGYYFPDLFNIARSILEQFPSRLFSIRFISDYVVHPYSCTDTTAAKKNSRFNLSDRYNSCSLPIHIIDSLSIAVNAFAGRILISLSVDETLPPRYVNLSTNSRGRPFWVEIAPSRLKHVLQCLLLLLLGPGYTTEIHLG